MDDVDSRSSDQNPDVRGQEGEEFVRRVRVIDEIDRFAINQAHPVGRDRPIRTPGHFAETPRIRCTIETNPNFGEHLTW